MPLIELILASAVYDGLDVARAIGLMSNWMVNPEYLSCSGSTLLIGVLVGVLVDVRLGAGLLVPTTVGVALGVKLDVLVDVGVGEALVVIPCTTTRPN